MIIIYADGKAESDVLAEMKARAGEADIDVAEAVREILKNVKEKGDEALRFYGEKFDGGFPSILEMGKDELKKAYDSMDDDFKSALLKATENIKSYHEYQREKPYEILKGEGINQIVLGQIIRGLEKVGVYVPGGKAAYPSTVLMNIIPAKIAGVDEIIMVTPPLVTENADGSKSYGANPDILAAAYIAGADRVFLTGGAQAVGALTYGTETIPKVDKIVGPGNIYVAIAKREVFGQVDIDMIAGPSEILIIADKTANPKYIAADLLSQAEHDTMAASILLTDCEEVAKETLKEVERQKSLLGRQDIMEESLENFGLIIICKTVDEMFEISNRIAPEHLEIMMENPIEHLKKVKNAGSVFCGDFTPEPLGDYYSGTNHVLPTSGTARYSSPLGVYSFVKKMSYTYYGEEALREAKEYVINIAEKEGLTAHANAIRIRFQ